MVLGAAPLHVQALPDVHGPAGGWGVPIWGMHGAVPPPMSHPFAPAAHYMAHGAELPTWRSMSAAGPDASAAGRVRGAGRLLQGLLRGAAAAAVLPMPNQAVGGDAPEAAGLLEESSEGMGAKIAPGSDVRVPAAAVAAAAAATAAAAAAARPSRQSADDEIELVKVELGAEAQISKAQISKAQISQARVDLSSHGGGGVGGGRSVGGGGSVGGSVGGGVGVGVGGGGGVGGGVGVGGVGVGGTGGVTELLRQWREALPDAKQPLSFKAHTHMHVHMRACTRPCTRPGPCTSPCPCPSP